MTEATESVHMVDLVLVFKKLHTVLYSGFNKLHSHQGYRSFFVFSCTPSPELIISRLFDDGHSDWCDVVSPCSFHLQFSNN